MNNIFLYIHASIDDQYSTITRVKIKPSAKVEILLNKIVKALKIPTKGKNE